MVVSVGAEQADAMQHLGMCAGERDSSSRVIAFQAASTKLDSIYCLAIAEGMSSSASKGLLLLLVAFSARNSLFLAFVKSSLAL